MPIAARWDVRWALGMLASSLAKTAGDLAAIECCMGALMVYVFTALLIESWGRRLKKSHHSKDSDAGRKGMFSASQITYAVVRRGSRMGR